MKKIKLILLLLSFNAVAIDRDFSVFNTNYSPFELLGMKNYSSGIENELVNGAIDFNNINESILKSFPLIARQAINDAEQYAIKHSLSKEQFVKNYLHSLRGEKNVLYEFYKKNIKKYKKTICDNYNVDTCKYYKKRYDGFNAITSLIRLYWSHKVVYGITSKYKITPRDDNHLQEKLNSYGLIGPEKKALFLLSAHYRKIILKGQN